MSRILCRLCALESEKFVDIYESDDSNTEIEAKIVSCLQIWVSKTKSNFSIFRLWSKSKK